MGTTCRILCLVAVLSQASALLTSPPRMVKQPVAGEQLFQVALKGEADKPFIIECEAEGEPAPKYRWEKNGKAFEYTSYDKRISQQPGRGTLYFTEPRDEDIGQYQCFAENEWGIAASNSVFLRKAELNSFKESDGQQQTQTAQEGYPFKLACQPPDGWPKPMVYWMLQGDQGQLKTINNSRMTLDPEGNLWFSNVTRHDASEDYAYTCAAKSSFRNEYKLGSKVFLVVQQTGIAPGLNKHAPVHQYTTRRNEVGLRGKKVELYCIYGGTPLPQTVWKKDGRSILSSQGVTQDNYGKTLVIKSAGYEDQGTYTCEVSNGVGTAQTYSINLNIQAAPIFTEEPQFLNLAEGETAEFRCQADGTPEPQIKWIYNGRPIERAPPNARRQVNPDSIIITDLVKNDTGNYGCNATNSLGYVYKDVYINVQSIPPEVKEGPGNLTKVDGSEAVLACRVFGAPRPLIKWIKDGAEVPGGRYNITTEGDLVIRSVTYTDVGTYQCYAKNKFGETSAFGSLTVKKRTVITDKPEHYEVAAGSSATFRCNANADDSLQLDIIWLKKDQPLDFENQPRFRMTNDYSLLISDTQELDSGEYTCIAKTAIDEARAQATLTVQDKPNPPELAGIECFEKVATLRWSPKGDNRAPILRFSIQYNTTFTPDTWDIANDNVPAIDTSWTVDLSPWANYTFRVIAWNKIGPSMPSSHSEVCTTQPDVPYKNPDNVEGKGTDPSNMVISWSPMPQIEHNGPGFYYLVSYRRNISGQAWTDELVREWRGTSLLVRNTPTFQPYKIKVSRAQRPGFYYLVSYRRNISGQAWTDELVREWRGTSLLVRNTPTFQPYKIKVSRAQRPGFYYLVSYRRNISGQAWTDELVREWRGTSLLVRNTPTFQPYKIKVIAVNSKGTSNVAPVEVIGWSGEDSPLQAPTNFTLVQVTSATTALFSWNPVTPESIRGHFKGYKIQTWTDDGDIREYKHKPDSKTALVNNLVAYSKNYARVLAYNERYNGPVSEVVSFVTPEGTPESVRSFKAYPIGSSAMLLRWDKPERENGILTGYKIYYQKVIGTATGSLQERKKEIDPKFDRAKLAGLEPNTKYRIIIKAKTRAGEGKDMFVEETTKSVETKIPDVPIFEASTLPAKQGTAHILVRWIPSLEGHAGTHFIAWYRLKAHPAWMKTNEVTDEDYTVLTGLEPGQVYEVKITAHDGEYFRDSEIKEVDTTIDGPVIMRDDKMAHAGWFIGVMLALAFLLLVLVLVCVARRNRGGKYDVHERELQHGRRDPSRPFQEYTQPLDSKSRHSMSSGTKHPESDTDSMAEYGEGETGRFTEDGSFIGQYVPGARVLPPPPPAGPAPPAQAPPTYV
ncbi:neuroglian isoform X2 [Plutella xylostella]|uniref:neuroglian isoform X2 n=1 Tax=Plutella xylostella TaxID=51655 RepID=UPI0020328C3D|nr:neuroglian isoform X2 [Plutella xylostella]